MRRRGLGPGIGETPLAWSQRISHRLVAGDRLLETVDLYCRLRYGDAEDEALRQRFLRNSRRIATDTVEPQRAAAV